MQNTIEQYDVIIIGGGVVGLSLACALAQLPLTVAIIETQKDLAKKWTEDNYDVRVSAINQASQRIFNALNVWPHMEKMRINPYQHMHVWDAVGQGSIDFDCTEVGAASLGYIVENSVMLQALSQRLQNLANVKIMTETVPVQLSITAEEVLLSLTGKRKLQAKLLIGADGFQSWVRQQAHIKLHSWSYQQQAIICTVRTEKSHQKTAWQRFLPNGTLAFLPLADPHLCSIVWSTANTHAQQLMELNDESFNQAITHDMMAKLGATEIIDQRLMFPLHMRHAKHYVKPRIALVGDAAHTLHPLAGQGVNLGLLDAACLAEVLQTAQEKKQNIGHLLVLRHYERWRKGDNLAMIAAMEGFKQLFNNSMPIISQIRSFGLQATNQLPWLKNRFIEKAMGTAGFLPRMAKHFH